MEEKELAKTEPAGSLALNNDEISDMFGESELDSGTSLSFGIIKILRESGQFEVGEKKFADTLTGHVLLKHQANQWWEIDYDSRKPEDSPVPNCYSVDGFKPSGGDKMFDGMCAVCDRNKFGSGKDERGKACRNTVRFLFLQEGSVLPVVIVAPPTSLGKKGSVQAWFNSVPNDVATAYTKVGMKNAKGGPIVEYWTAKVELSLEKEKFAGGEASVLKIQTLEVIVPKNDDGTPNAEGASKLRMLHQAVIKSREAYNEERHAYIESEAGDEPVATQGNEAESFNDEPIEFDENVEIPAF